MEQEGQRVIKKIVVVDLQSRKFLTNFVKGTEM